MAKRKKRAPGAGRKPQGEFDQLTSPFSLRMPDGLREQLEVAAEKSGRSASQELLMRLNMSFAQARDKNRDPAMRALCFLIGEAAHQTTALHVIDGESEVDIFNWRSHPFFYKAFKLAVCRILDALAPVGEIMTPKVRLDEHSAKSAEIDNAVKRWLESFRSPEARAEYSADYILHSLREIPRLSHKEREEQREHLKNLGVPSFLREFYGMPDAARDMDYKPLSGKTLEIQLPFAPVQRHPKKSKSRKTRI